MHDFGYYEGSAVEERISALVRNGKHFGRQGSLQVFWRHFASDVAEAAEAKKPEWVMCWVSLLHSALTSAAKKGGFINKVRAMWLLYRANSIVAKLRGEDSYSLYEKLGVGECHTLLSLYGRNLEVFQYLHLGAFFRHKSDMGFNSLLKVIAKKTSEDLNNDSYLAAIGFAYELHRKDVRHMLYADTAKDTILQFCHNNETSDLGTAQLVARLYRYLDMDKEALKVSQRFSLRDQAIKAGGK